MCRFSTASLRNLRQIMYPSEMQLFTCKLGMLAYVKSKVVLALQSWMKGVLLQTSPSYSLEWPLCMRTFLTQKCHWLLWETVGSILCKNNVSEELWTTKQRRICNSVLIYEWEEGKALPHKKMPTNKCRSNDRIRSPNTVKVINSSKNHG